MRKIDGSNNFLLESRRRQHRDEQQAQKALVARVVAMVTAKRAATAAVADSAQLINKSVDITVDSIIDRSNTTVL